MALRGRCTGVDGDGAVGGRLHSRHDGSLRFRCPSPPYGNGSLAIM